ncbi:hypothetical protein PsorP6_002255 [Peronosclerospora sorghi]|uniref:Uncharacterized protein n=1 Tax=Peronosclerospora sorghi TaxID=230839 RepID=A0ACC0WX71_9STRA|nr:hypothetical protein PsorP6_002255 [Peronosclerospora sorghi]
MDVRGFLLMTEEFFRQKRHEDTVAWYKTGLEIHPDIEELLKGLKKARVAVLNELLQQSDDSEEEVLNNGECIDHKCVESADIKQSEGAKNSSLLSVQSAKHMHTHMDSNEILMNKSENSATQDLVFQAKMERVLEFLDVMKLARLAAVYACSELLNTVMLIPMLVMCIYRSRLKERVARFAQDWVNGSTDKLGAMAWSPRVAIVIFLFMKIFGQVQFMLFLQQDVRLICVVFMVTSMLVVNFCVRLLENTQSCVVNGPIHYDCLDLYLLIQEELYWSRQITYRPMVTWMCVFFLDKVYQARNNLTETVTYLMSSLFVHYAHVRNKIKSVTLFADIDADT